MAAKTISMREVTETGNALLTVWNDCKKQVQLKGKTLFSLIGLKKTLEKHLFDAQEAITIIAEKHNGVLDPEAGGYQIPEDQRELASKAMNDLMKSEVEVVYEPLKISEEDYLPAELLDAIYDFVDMV